MKFKIDTENIREGRRFRPGSWYNKVIVVGLASYTKGNHNIQDCVIARFRHGIFSRKCWIEIWNHGVLKGCGSGTSVFSSDAVAMKNAVENAGLGYSLTKGPPNFDRENPRLYAGNIVDFLKSIGRKFSILNEIITVRTY